MNTHFCDPLDQALNHFVHLPLVNILFGNQLMRPAGLEQEGTA